MRRAIRILAVAAIGLLLTGCDLLPKEETYRTAPLIREYATESFEQALCTRGDMQLTKSISCVYVPVRSEALSFKIGGEKFDTVYVSAGDSVEEGQLLCQLVLSGVEERIDDVQRQIERLLVQKDYLSRYRALALQRRSIADSALSSAAKQDAIDAVNADYDAREQSVDDQLTLLRLRLEGYQAELSARQLRAPMSGTVTYVRRIKPSDVTVLGERVITVVDSTLSLFRTETDLWPYFTPGDRVTITAKKVEYEAIVASEDELGLPAQEKVEGQKAFVYFALVEPTFDLEDNDRGTLTLLLDSREDVLRVPEKAISTINGHTVVYYQNDEGLRAYKDVEVGLYAGGMVEILSGLSEGELVIAE